MSLYLVGTRTSRPAVLVLLAAAVGAGPADLCTVERETLRHLRIFTGHRSRAQRGTTERTRSSTSSRAAGSARRPADHRTRRGLAVSVLGLVIAVIALAANTPTVSVRLRGPRLYDQPNRRETGYGPQARPPPGLLRLPRLL
ncbi:hypothetical protein PL81_24535 [Streptomyces sp. RSD-27]|nr:hypothetical protein PL81_24535 [Streptomyces sp. RSD-27]